MIFHPKTLLASLLVCIAITATAQTYNSYYDLNFRERGHCWGRWVFTHGQSEEGYVHNEQTDNDSIWFLKYQNTYAITRMYAYLRKHIVLPKIPIKDLEAGLTVKALNTKDFAFRVVGIDANNEISFDEQVTVKPSADWMEYNIKTLTRSTRAIYLYINYWGDNNPDQTLFFKQVTIKVNGKDIENLAIHRYSDPIKLKDKQVIALNPNDSVSITQCLGDLTDKKIIGLGEMTHGSKSLAQAKYQFTKSLILNHTCRLVLTEYPVDIMLLANLFVQGLGDEQDNSLKDYLKVITKEGGPLGEFLHWLKKHNETTTEKVHIFGIDNKSEVTLPLSDFHLALLGREKAKPYLKALLSSGYIDTINELNNRFGEVKALLDKKLYCHYESVLNTRAPKDRNDWLSDRDSLMFRRTLFLDSLFNVPDGKIVILSHSGHLKKTLRVVPDARKQYPVLGTLLHQHLGATYFNIDFTFGTGTFLQDSCLQGVRFIVDTLKPPPEHSFEYAALKTGIPYLYYPAASLGNQSGTTAEISNGERDKDPFHYTTFRKRTDGYVFLRRSEVFDNASKSPFADGYIFYETRSRLHREILGIKTPGL